MGRKRRYHYTYLFELFFRQNTASIAAGVTACLSLASYMTVDGNLHRELPLGKLLLLSLAALLLCGGGVLAVCALQWQHTYMTVREDALSFEHGFFRKKRVTVPYARIHAIDMKRNVFEKLAGTCRLTIDAGTASDRGTKDHLPAELVLGLKEAYNLRRFLLSRMEHGVSSQPRGTWEEPQWVFHAKGSDFLLSGLTSSALWAFLWLPVIGVCIAAEISPAAVHRFAQTTRPLLRGLAVRAETWGVPKTLLCMTGLWLAGSLAAGLAEAVIAAVRFFDFRMTRQGQNLLVRYGLLTEKHFTLQARNIQAVIIRQTFWQQCIGRCSVEAVCTGAGNIRTVSVTLAPLLPCKTLNELLRRILPEFIAEERYRPHDPIGLLFHVFAPTLLCSAVCLAVHQWCALLTTHLLLARLCGGIAVLLTLLGGILSYRNTAMDGNRRVISVQSGGFRKTLCRIRTDAVQEVQFKTTIIQEAFGVGSYRVCYQGAHFHTAAVAGSLPAAFLQALTAVTEQS